MAKRAVRPDDPEREIFELDKDERWQARLAEARARREVALREKANSGAVPKRRPKPWEEAGQGDVTPVVPVEPVFQPEPDPKPDFADRMKSLRKTIQQHGSNSRPSNEARPAPPTPIVPDVPETAPVLEPEQPAAKPKVADRYLDALSPDFEPVRPFVPEVSGYGVEPTPTIGVPLVREEPPEPVTAPSPPVETEAQVSETPLPKIRRSRVPALLLAAICLFSLLPFTTEAPPMEIGPPIFAAEPRFGLEPALGITRPMNVIPRTTMSWEWMPELNRAVAGPLAVAATPGVDRANSVAPLVDVAPGAEGFGEFDWTALGGSPGRGASPAMAAPFVDALPGEAGPPVARSLNAKPAPRPEAAVSEDQASTVWPVPESPLRVTILMPPNADAGEAEAIAEDVLARGHDLARIKPVDLKISQRNLRFFHGEDRREAARLAEAYDARLRDFTSFRPSPKEGTVEVWLAGRGTPGKTVQRRVDAPVPEPVVAEPEIIIIQRQPSLIDRLTDILGQGW